MKSLKEMEELKRGQVSTFDEFSKRRLIDNQDTVHELTTRIQELRNEVNCVYDPRDFQDAESVPSGLTLPVNLRYSHLIVRSWSNFATTRSRSQSETGWVVESTVPASKSSWMQRQAEPLQCNEVPDVSDLSQHQRCGCNVS